MFAFTSLGVVLVSTMTFVLGTFPEFQPKEESGVELPCDLPLPCDYLVKGMDIIDKIAVTFFLIEYVVRLKY